MPDQFQKLFSLKHGKMGSRLKNTTLKFPLMQFKVKQLIPVDAVESEVWFIHCLCSLKPQEGSSSPLG